MPWLEVLAQESYKFLWTNKYFQAQNIVLRKYCMKKKIELIYRLT
jgi:hypothetical protein